MGSEPTLEQRFEGYFLAVADRPPSTRYLAIWGESAALAGLAFALPLSFGVAHVEVGVFCLFLTATSLHHRFAFLLDEHRGLIFEQGWAPRAAHTRTAVSVLAMFVGMCTAWALVVGLLSTASIKDVFGYVLDLTGADPGGLLGREFGQPVAILGHNLGVMSAVVILCLFYRSYGAVLVLAWNASTWVVALSTLVRGSGSESALPPAAFGLLAMLAVLPHLVLELGAYVLASLAAIFVSKAMTRYDWRDETMGEIVGSSLQILAAATATLAMAAMIESVLPPAVLHRL